MATLMNMPIEILLMVINSMSSKDLARLSKTCKYAQKIVEERLYRLCSLKRLISPTLQPGLQISTLEKWRQYRKEPDGQKYFIDGIPALMRAALQKDSCTVNLLLNSGFVVTKKTILTLLSQDKESQIIQMFINGALNGYDMLVKMMVDCISDLKDIEVGKTHYRDDIWFLQDIFNAASLDRPEITKSVLLILPRSDRQILRYNAMIFGIDRGWCDRNQREKAVRSLLAHGADPRLHDHQALLESAAERGYHEIVSIMLQTEKFNGRSISHQRAWRIAKNRGHHTVLKALFPERRVSGRRPTVPE